MATKNRLQVLNAYEPKLGRRDDGRWSLSFSYNDMNLAVVIDHNWADDDVGYEVLVTNYDVFDDVLRYESGDQRKARHELMKEHGDFDHHKDPDCGYFTMGEVHDKAIGVRIEECLRRWDAVCMLASPQVSMYVPAMK